MMFIFLVVLFDAKFKTGKNKRG